MENNYEERAIKILHDTYGDDASFRDGQLDAILAVLNKKKTLVVQKTGWGKSIVYFIATKILREDGAGPAIIISPLLALMKNQVDSAKKFGINAITINSDNINKNIDNYESLNTADAIIVSPERLSDEKFMNKLSEIQNVSLFVVDEAHSISDWGHDFRPDYQRIVKLLSNFPSDVSILATTATANDRVIKDIEDQLGHDIEVIRGDLMRENLVIQVNPCQTKEEKLAWIYQYLTTDSRLNNKQGIIYCLTQRDCEAVSAFLKSNNISAESYHSGLGKDENGENIAEKRIIEFDEGKLKILVATTKLGMGYDKPDIRFIIHYQLPQNIISYYQQIGRAGRDGEGAYAILLYGKADEEILNYFINNSQANSKLLENILTSIGNGAKLNDLLENINVSKGKLLEALNYLSIHDYIYKEKTSYYRNISLEFDNIAESQKQENLNETRKSELENLKEYLDINSCYMKFIADELDAPDAKLICGDCKNCKNDYIIPVSINPENLEMVRAFFKNKHGEIQPRKKYADNKTIPENRRYETGLVLNEDYFSQIGQQVKKGKYEDNYFSDELVDMSYACLREFVKNKEIDLVVAVPSSERKELVPNFSERLAKKLDIDFENAVEKTKDAEKQKNLLNSSQQQKNIEETTKVFGENIQNKTILLVDDMVDSRWSFAIIAVKLLEAGAKSVYPFALVKTGNGE